MPLRRAAHSKNTLQSGDFLVMVTDGVLEYLHVKDRQGKLMDIIAGVKSDNAGVLAQEILDRVLLDTGGYAMDDMTVVAIESLRKVMIGTDKRIYSGKQDDKKSQHGACCAVGRCGFSLPSAGVK